MQLSRVVAAAVVVLLGGAVVFSLRQVGATDGAAAVRPSRSSATPGVPSTVMTTRPTPRSDQAPPTTAADVGDPAVVAAEGLAAWGRLAASGDLDDVRGLFADDGPQMELFESEPGVGGLPYAVTFKEEERVVTGEEARLSGVVRFVRTGEPTQSFRWTVVLRQSGGEWSIWTVEETQPATG